MLFRVYTMLQLDGMKTVGGIVDKSLRAYNTANIC